MPLNKIAARFLDGRVVKGHTGDFLPTKALFHLTPETQASPHDKPIEIRMADLKAVYFVKDLASQGHEQPHGTEFTPGKAAVGRKIRVEFLDGEILVGTTQGYDPSRPGFFVIPADAASNNERCFVVAAAVRQVSFL